MMSYMGLVQNKANNLALVRIVNEPKRGVGGKTLQKLQALAQVRGCSLFDVLLDDEIISSFSTKVSENLKQFASLIEAYSI